MMYTNQPKSGTDSFYSDTLKRIVFFDYERCDDGNDWIIPNLDSDEMWAELDIINEIKGGENGIKIHY